MRNGLNSAVIEPSSNSYCIMPLVMQSMVELASSKIRNHEVPMPGMASSYLSLV